MSFQAINGNIQRRMRELRENGELDPVTFGFKSWNQYDKGRLLQGSRKCTLMIGGEPNHGKSQFCNELVIQMIEKHNFKVALFSTESGDIEKVFTQFCGYYIGKPYAKIRPDGKPNPYAMTDSEADEAEHFLLGQLYIFRQNRKDTTYNTLDNIYKELYDAEKAYDIRFDSLVIDPVYDVQDFEPKAEEVLRVLNRFNLEAEENNRFDIVVNHVSETAKFTDKSGKRRKLIALADEFYGGKNNNRKAMLQVLVHRPTPTVDEGGRWIDESDNKEVIFPNQTDIHILKIKPEGIAKWGKYEIFYDWRSRRYYEKDELGEAMFADCTKFYGRKPNVAINIEEIRPTPEQAFETTNYYETEGEHDGLPF